MFLPISLLNEVLQKKLPFHGSHVYASHEDVTQVPLYKNCGHISNADGTGTTLKQISTLTFQKGPDGWELNVISKEEFDRLKSVIEDLKWQLNKAKAENR